MDPCRIENNGVYQSPIALPPIAFTYVSESKLEIICDRINGIYNPHARNWPMLNDICIKHNGSEFRLNEFHFHFPGEHLICGQRFIGELHFVFTNEQSMFVIGFVIEESFESKSSKVLRRILKNRPFRFPRIKSYYSYPGALTTPPFNINVNWNINSKPLTINKCDVPLMVRIAKLARNIQPRNGRNINYLT